MTDMYPSHPHQGWPLRPAARRRWPLVVGGIVVAVAAVAAVLAVRVFVGGGSSGDADSGSSVSGDRSQWTAAVCAPHSDLATSSNFLYPDATDIAYCSTNRPAAGSMPQPVVIGEWPRGADLAADIARLESVHWFATATAGDTTTVFILLDSPDRALLEPLLPFGFEIHAPA